MSIFNKIFGRNISQQALATPCNDSVTKPKVCKAKLNPGTVRFFPVFQSGSIGPAHQTFIGAVDSNTRRPVRILRIEIDPMELVVMGAATLDPFSAMETA